MMERHLASQIRQWRFGMGLMGEQGAESIHTTFNTIERCYSSIANKKERLLRVTQEHHLRIEPDNVALAPPIKKRKSDTCTSLPPY
jgi:hypothetical protein